MELPPAILALIEGLQRDIAELRAENAALREEVADLKRRLGKDSSNSGKPPSSDGLGKKPRVAGSLRGRSGKKSGGQPGHKGDTLRAVAEPDRIVAYEAFACEHCASPLSATMRTGVEKRQVFDLPQPRLEVTEHQALAYRCPCCDGVTQAAFPDDVTGHVQYGPRLRAAAVYMNVQQLVPEDRVGDILRDLFGAARLCPASITTWVARKAAMLAPFTHHLAKLVARAPVRNLDETGFRIGGKTQWLHTASTPDLTHYRVSSKRGAMPEDFEGGVIVHDHFSPYYNLPGVDHALCNAHHLRELKALIDIEKEPWARKMSKLLRIARRAVHSAENAGATALSARKRQRLSSAYDAITAEGIAFHETQPPLVRAGVRGRYPRRPGHNLLIRLTCFKADTLRFIADFAVPFTNNQAERDIRMMKVKMKISGGFRTQAGAEIFATIRATLSTGRKQGWNMLDTLAAQPSGLIRALP